MKTVLLLTILISASCSLFANPTCNVSHDKWLKESDFKLMLRKQGYLIKTFKVENGCFWIYGLDNVGMRVETYFNPATGEPTS